VRNSLLPSATKPISLIFFFSRADPGKQFDLVVSHLQNIKRLPGFEASRFTIYVERNLGFEAGEIFLH